MRFRFAALIAAAALALPATAHAGASIDLLASSAAGRSVTVTCSVPDDAPEAGWTVIGSSSIAVSPSTCRLLGHLAAGDAAWLKSSTDSVRRADLAGVAVQVLVHEATHLRLASGDEALVECTASANYWPTVAAAHLPAKLARRILAAAQHTHANLRDPHYKETC